MVKAAPDWRSISRFSLRRSETRDLVLAALQLQANARSDDAGD